MMGSHTEVVSIVCPLSADEMSQKLRLSIPKFLSVPLFRTMCVKLLFRWHLLSAESFYSKMLICLMAYLQTNPELNVYSGVSWQLCQQRLCRTAQHMYKTAQNIDVHYRKHERSPIIKISDRFSSWTIFCRQKVLSCSLSNTRITEFWTKRSRVGGTLVACVCIAQEISVMLMSQVLDREFDDHGTLASSTPC